MSDDVVLELGAARLAISPVGAEARSWRVGGVDLLWPGDPAIWPEISPILYPVVGWTRDGARVGGQHYDLQLHGFARRRVFALEKETADFARFMLTDDAATRAVYPFAFRFAVEYALGPDSLSITLEVENTDTRSAPYACGLHPGFNWPFAHGRREGALIRFEKPERAEVPVMVPGGLIGKAMRAVPLNGPELVLDEKLFAADALCFLDLASRSLRFEQADGSAIEMNFPGFQHCGLWMRPGGRYLCLEPWTGYSDPEGFSGNLFEKPSMKTLAPGECARHGARFKFTPSIG